MSKVARVVILVRPKLLIQMLAGDTLNDAPALLSRESVFDFIHTLTQQRQQQSYLLPVLSLVNAAIHLLLFLSLPRLDLLDLLALLPALASPTMLILLGAIEGAVAVQVGLCLVWKKEQYLLLQVEAVCFVVEPLLLISTLGLIHDNSISVGLACGICLASELFSNMLAYSLLFETYRVYSLRCRGTFIATEMILFQTILIALAFVTLPGLQLILTLILLLLSLHTYLRHFTAIEMDTPEYRVLKAVNLMHTAMSTVMLLLDIFGTTASSTLLLVTAGTVCLFLLLSLLSTQKIEQMRLRQIFMHEAGYDQLLLTIDYLSGVIRKGDGSQDTELQSFIFSAISEHSKVCTQASCDLLSATTQEELKDPNSKNLRQLSQKILKKLEALLHTFHQASADSKDITFSFLRFYAYVLNSRHKLSTLLAETAHLRLSWGEESELYQYRRLCEAFENTEAIDVTQAEEDVVEFESTLVSTLTSMEEFWAEFYEEKVDLKKVMLISAKISPSKARLEQIFQRKLSEEKFSSYKVFTLYALYLRLILHQPEEALKVEDYTGVLAERLKDKQEMKYLSKETESGFIVISLSETKLGSIHMMSEVALNIFKYARKDVLGRNISSIMPQTYAYKHDNILLDFLKRKRQSFNTDQRLLFGKDSNGYIFPVLLQLQKASYSANDEFIFIGMVKHNKLKSSPHFCIVDLEGYIREVTASFQSVFFGTAKRNQSRSIQEIIPNYFDEHYSEDMCEDRILHATISSPKTGLVNAEFDLKPIVVKGEHLGFLVGMSYPQKPIRKFSSNERFTERLMRLRNAEELQCCENSYNQDINAFEVQMEESGLGPMRLTSGFSLPFLNYQDLADFADGHEARVYGADIKTVRYVKRHFQRKEEEETFHSEVFSDSGKVNIKAKIAEMRQKSAKKDEQRVVDCEVVAIGVVMVVVMVVLGLLYSIYQQEPIDQASRLQMYEYEKQVRYYLPEYVIYSSLISSNVSSSYFQARLDDLRAPFIDSLVHSPLSQSQKESILRIIYKQEGEQIELSLSSTQESARQEEHKVLTEIYLMWTIVMVCCLALGGLLVVVLENYKSRRLGVYTVFLSLKEPSIKHTYEACRQLVSRVHQQVNRAEDEEEALSTGGNKEDENEIQKIKQFRVTSTPEDCSFLLQMLLPVCLLLGYSLAVMLLSTADLREFIGLRHFYDDYFEVMPQTSIELMKAVMVANSQPMVIHNNFQYYLQRIENSLAQFQQDTDEFDFMNILYGNVCLNPVAIPQNHRLSCQLIENGILAHGIAPALNYLSQQFTHVSIASPLAQTRLLAILELQFMFINPVMLRVVQQMRNIILAKIGRNSSLQATLSLVGLGLFLLFGLYLLLFPLNHIQRNIATTNAMIALMPPDPHDSTP